MRLSVSTGLHGKKRGEGFFTTENSIRALAKAGFKVFDLSFITVLEECSDSKDWDRKINRLADLKEELAIDYNQAHPPFYNMLCHIEGRDNHKDEYIKKSITASEKLGVKYNAMHLGTSYDGIDYRKASLEKNYEYFAPLLELAEKHNTTLTFENMADMFRKNKKDQQRVFSASLVELVDFVDSMDCDKAQILWDFGHANLVGENQVESLKFIGKRLKALHVQDNYGQVDDHLPPFFGSINWEEIMPVLSEIGYEGDFSFEIQNFARDLPLELRQEAYALTVSIGNYLIKQA